MFGGSWYNPESITREMTEPVKKKQQKWEQNIAKENDVLRACTEVLESWNNFGNVVRALTHTVDASQVIGKFQNCQMIANML